ncbi:hypothetical protein MMC14_000652 [Varicellaria rhodocarpa]|nr:hypothetical protein [Varicellaria rhodocarpa]
MTKRMCSTSYHLPSPRTLYNSGESIERRASFWVSYLQTIIPENLEVHLDPPKGLKDEELSEDEKSKLEPRMGVHVKRSTGELAIEGLIRMTASDDDAIDVADQSTMHHFPMSGMQPRAFFVLDETIQFFVIQDEERRAPVPPLNPQTSSGQIQAYLKDFCSMNN